jgi:hypothetical protein
MLLFLVSLFAGVYGSDYTYQLTIEQASGCQCDTTNVTVRYGDITDCVEAMYLYPTIPVGLNVAFNISYGTPNGWVWTIYGNGSLNACSFSSPITSGDFNCLNCAQLNKYWRNDTSSWWVVCLMQIECNFLRAAPPEPEIQSKSIQPKPKTIEPKSPSAPYTSSTHEHYEKSSTREVYDRTTNGSPVQSENAYALDNWRTFFTHSAPASAGSWSSVAMLLFFITVLVSLMASGYVYKRCSKRFEYEAVPDSVDNDSLLYTCTER